MRILILGATGPTGRLVLERALQSGDTITVLARRPEAWNELKGKIRVIAGDATSPDDMVKAMMGQEAVISTLGTGKSLRADELFTRAADAVIQAAKQTGVTRLVWMSSFGVGDTIQDASLGQKIIYKTLLSNVFRNKEASEQKIRESGLNWTIVYPTTLKNGPARGEYRVAERMKMKGTAWINRADVADFIYKAVYDDEWICRDAVITY